MTMHPDNIAGGPQRNDWAGLREQLRTIIRAEVDALQPTDDARRALELIIESRLRISHADGRLTIRAVDPDGRIRMKDDNGQLVPFTIHDLIQELRASHPVLFKRSSPRSSRPTKPAGEQADTAGPAPRPGRDWLRLGPSASEPSRDSMPARSESGRIALKKVFGAHLLNRFGRPPSAKPFAAPAAPRAERRPESASASRAESLIETVDRPPLHRRPGFASATLALVVLLAVGAFTLLGGDRSSVEADPDEPLATGSTGISRGVGRTTASLSGPRTLRGVPDVIDTATLSLQGEVVRLFGVEWAPGGGVPDDLTRYLDGREVVCRPARGEERYRCQVGEQDLSRVVLYNGGGKPTPEATPDLKAAADRAREAGIGVWKQRP